MPQPRIDMRVIRAGVAVIRDNFYELEREYDESLTELAAELEDHADGANILVALTPRECEAAIEALAFAKEVWDDMYFAPSWACLSGTLNVLEELTSALRGVTVATHV